MRAERAAALAVVAVGAVIALGACGGFIDRQAATSTYKILRASVDESRREADVELARAAVPGGLLQLAAFARAYPDFRGFAELHAEAICGYAVAFVFDDWEDATLGRRADEAARIADRLTGLLARCVDANLALLDPAWRAARTAGGDALARRLPSATPADAGPLRWIATADAVAIALAPLRGLTSLAPTRAVLQRCATLAPGAHDADAELLLGTLEAAVHPLLGGPDGRAWFAAARRALGPGALWLDVTEARATLRDRARLEAALRAALATDLARYPDRRLANELARRKATRYLAALDQLIPPGSGASGMQ